jgi:uncharacterized protein
MTGNRGILAPSMVAFSIRLDPWSADYDASIQLPEVTDEPPARVRCDVERPDWAAVRPAAAPLSPLAFVDGVRRIEHRLLIADEGRTLFGLLGSFGVGAVCADGAAHVVRADVHRVACVGGGVLLPEPFVVPVGRCQPLAFAPEAAAENTPTAPVQGLQNAMRRAEAVLAEELAGTGLPVLLDGPLSFLAHEGPVVGFVKRLVRPYLPAREASLLVPLAVGERTPLFLIEDALYPRYSWYARLAWGRAIQSPLAGVVRLETGTRRGLPEALELADAVTATLPLLSSTSYHDPRAPQNLHPIGGLELRLRHLLGDALLIRRAVESRLHREVA